MILSGSELRIRLEGKEKSIVINPYNPKQVNSNSYDLTLHDKLLIYDTARIVDCFLDVKNNNPTKLYTIPLEGFVLLPGILYLGRTNEWTETKGLVPLIEGKSSIGRLGLSIHVTAGFGDNGFRGYWTLELSCIYPIRIYPNIRICQIMYHTISQYNESDIYKGKYQDSKEVIPSRSYEDKEQL